MTRLTAQVKVVNEKGIHTRTSTAFVKRALEFRSLVLLSTPTQTANGKSVMELLTLAAKKGTVLTMTVEGDDQEEALEALKSMIEGGFPGVNDEGTH